MVAVGDGAGGRYEEAHAQIVKRLGGLHLRELSYFVFVLECHVEVGHSGKRTL